MLLPNVNNPTVTDTKVNEKEKAYTKDSKAL
jgi:hypothetical protein